MRKQVLFFLAILLCFGPFILQAGKYTKIKPVLTEMADAFEMFVTGLEKAESAEAVAAVLDKHAKAVLNLAPKVKKILEEYPELKDESTHPEELKPILTKMDDLVKKMAGLFGKIGQYADDPVVKAANERWQKAMASIEETEEEEEEQ